MGLSKRHLLSAVRRCSLRFSFYSLPYCCHGAGEAQFYFSFSKVSLFTSWPSWLSFYDGLPIWALAPAPMTHVGCSSAQVINLGQVLREGRTLAVTTVSAAGLGRSRRWGRCLVR